MEAARCRPVPEELEDLRLRFNDAKQRLTVYVVIKYVVIEKDDVSRVNRNAAAAWGVYIDGVGHGVNRNAKATPLQFVQDLDRPPSGLSFRRRRRLNAFHAESPVRAARNS
jgi:hypothetical protein